MGIPRPAWQAQILSNIISLSSDNVPIKIFCGGGDLVFPQLTVTVIREHNRGSCIIMLVTLLSKIK
jgi:hypothetical protein